MNNHVRNTVALGALLRGLCHFLATGAIQRADAFPYPWLEKFRNCVDGDLFISLLAEPTAANSELASAATIAPTEAAIPALVAQAFRALTTNELTSPARVLFPAFGRAELLSAANAPAHHFSWRPLEGTIGDEPPIFPNQQTNSPAESEDYHRRLHAELDRLCRNLDWSDFNCVYTNFLGLLQQYGWCLPADNQPDPPDVSLYDQSRIASALATCFYQHYAGQSERATREQARCLLVAGDLSGIQDYIFAISTTGAGGVAKRLRARSFFVQMLSDIAGLRLLHKFELPLANLLMASGGNFYVLLPNLPDTVRRVRDLQSDLNRWLLDKFHGVLTISMAWTEVADYEFAAGHFGAVNERLHSLLRASKAQRLADQLQDGTGWRQQFVRPAHFRGEQICRSCSRFPITKFGSREARENNERDVCDQCFDQQELGRQLTKAKYISFFTQSARGYNCLGWKFLLHENPPPPTAKPELVVRLNDPDLNQVRGLPAAFRYLTNHIPHKANDEPWTFTEIAAEKEDVETTTKLLGVLKADVDYLGQVIQEGLRRDSSATDDVTGFDNLTRIATLSRQLDWFFSGWLEWLLTNKYPSCYAVYAGGDDLLIVGPRVATLKLAREINSAFARYTNNPQLTLSAGIAVVKARLPLAHTVKMADKALQQAKESNRNRLSMLDEVTEWGNLRRFDEISSLLEESAPPSALLYQLLRFAEMWRGFVDPEKLDVRGLKLLPMLAETLARNVDIRKQPKLHQWGCSLLAFPFRTEAVQADLNQLALTVRWFILGRREK
jgi:CRISPR-associated protein Csm1